MSNNQLWYTRRDDQIRGPFPAPQISRFILLGRIIDTDELSTDQRNWQKVSEVPVLVPEELKADLSDPEAYQKLMIARMREDERNARDRRDGTKPGEPMPERRKADKGRRKDEEEAMIRHREIKTAIAEAAAQRKQHYFLRGVLATLFLVSIIGAAWYFQPWQEEGSAADCNALPQPWVNWNNCLMEGVKLVTADLRGAHLRNTNLAGADLRGAQLAGADIAYANLVGAKVSGAELPQAILLGANLRNADVSSANLHGADLSYAILQGTDLTNADLTESNLNNADLTGAKLKTARLQGARLDHAIWVDGGVCATGSLGRCNKK
ncbi:MAG TPA: pentapeptide repeat-containing protein [Thiolapillus brandeum]|uniref:Pentapeptide repeat-containing protein n=1 Tax=Thiolapillus brandeum TaxID=1076588 RepID=A0A831W8V1_9GAMM|nr:pentapeptide repeat-containing protein [Thiolapillus brandeum]